MATEYEFSARLVFWGDLLDSKRLGNDLGLIVTQSRTKGEPLRLPDGTQSGSVAKTSTLSCECSQDGNLRREPESQLLEIAGALRQLAGPVGKMYDVTEAQLQLDVYYGKKISGVPDFIFPSDLLDLLALHKIVLRITVLP
jgi:hypothetical protein